MKNSEKLKKHNDEHITTVRGPGCYDFHSNNGDFHSFCSTEGADTKIPKTQKYRDLGSNVDVPLLSENEKRELVSLVKDKNISMDFILEMKEAFLLFDKVGRRYAYNTFMLKDINLILVILLFL